MSLEEEKFYSIDKAYEGLYKEKGSKFIAYLLPVKAELEIKAILSQLRSKHPLAVHYCYAYRLGAKGELYRANDDGEPAGTAGKPIYNQLLSKNITNCLLVVVRYYGGIKLGVSGMINAYKEASYDALSKAIIIESKIKDYFELSFDYASVNDVNKLLREEQGEIVEKYF